MSGPVVSAELKLGSFFGNTNANSQEYKFSVKKVELVKGLELDVGLSLRNRSPHEFDSLGKTASEVKDVGGTQTHFTSLHKKDDLALRALNLGLTGLISKSKKSIESDDEKKEILIEDKLVWQAALGWIQPHSFGGKAGFKLLTSHEPTLMKPGKDPYSLGGGIALVNKVKKKEYTIIEEDKKLKKEKDLEVWHLALSMVAANPDGFEWGKKIKDGETTSVNPFDGFMERGVQTVLSGCYDDKKNKFCGFVLYDTSEGKGGTAVSANYKRSTKVGEGQSQVKLAAGVAGTYYKTNAGDKETGEVLPGAVEASVHGGAAYSLGQFFGKNYKDLLVFTLQGSLVYSRLPDGIVVDPDGGFTTRDQNFDNIDGTHIDADDDDVDARYGNETDQVVHDYSLINIMAGFTSKYSFHKDLDTGEELSVSGDLFWTNWWETKFDSTSGETDDEFTHLGNLNFKGGIKYTF